MQRPTSPKRTSVTGKASWYNYYAGYSPDFVRDVVASLGLPPDARILDPWNGAGTTTQVADELGLAGLGYDINPVMVVVAKARLLVGSQVHPSEESLCESILDGTVGSLAHVPVPDPLETWFAPNAARALRGIEGRIRELLVPGTTTPLLASDSKFDFDRFSSLAAFFYVALFRVVRDLITPFCTSNPTWIKGPASPEERLGTSVAVIRKMFRNQVAQMGVAALGATKQHSTAPQDRPKAVIDVADSTLLPVADASVDAVISSPPYCTRIDYAVATWPELAVLGLEKNRLRSLRGAMIGSATVGPELPVIEDGWGPTCRRFLDAVAVHPSKGSRRYYWKTHLQYFDGIAKSLRQLDRVLLPGGPCVLVAQDSFYKELHNDLPQVIAEMADNIGWTLVARHDYSARSVMATLHPRGRVYRKRTRAVESALYFTKRTA